MTLVPSTTLIKQPPLSLQFQIQNHPPPSSQVPLLSSLSLSFRHPHKTLQETIFPKNRNTQNSENRKQWNPNTTNPQPLHLLLTPLSSGTSPISAPPGTPLSTPISPLPTPNSSPHANTLLARPPPPPPAAADPNSPGDSERSSSNSPNRPEKPKSTKRNRSGRSRNRSPFGSISFSKTPPRAVAMCQK